MVHLRTGKPANWTTGSEDRGDVIGKLLAQAVHGPSWIAVGVKDLEQAILDFARELVRGVR